LTDHIGLGVLSARFNRDLLEEVLNRTGRREKRSRRLPAHVMIRYVIAMGLFFEESYDEVMRRLVGNLRKLGSWIDDWQVPTASAISQARQRLGVAPVRALFERTAAPERSRLRSTATLVSRCRCRAPAADRSRRPWSRSRCSASRRSRSARRSAAVASSSPRCVGSSWWELPWCARRGTGAAAGCAGGSRRR
jgi:hypothetical protein